jgi:hypothetical protein
MLNFKELLDGFWWNFILEFLTGSCTVIYIYVNTQNIETDYTSVRQCACNAKKPMWLRHLYLVAKLSTCKREEPCSISFQDEAVDLQKGRTLLNSFPGHRLSLDFLWFCSVFPEIYQDNTAIKHDSFHTHPSKSIIY